MFDPIRETGARPAFYRMTRDLYIDLDDYRSQALRFRPRVVLLIHFFGYQEPSAREVVRIAREHGALVVEDEAHALYSDWVSGACGRDGDATILSIHKMLPMPSGGLLQLNRTLGESIKDRLVSSPLIKALPGDLVSFDLPSIAAIRRKRAKELMALLQPLRGRIDLLRPTLPEGTVPQSLPVLVSGGHRDRLYAELNCAGFGAVSLYHTLITSITQADYPDSHWLAGSIFNLPIHQDVQDGELEALVATAASLLS